MSGGLLGVALRRIGVALPLIFLVSVLVFVVLRLIPSDPVAMSVPPNATKEEIEAVRRELGLHLPIFEQFWIWFGKVISGDFGKSIAFSQSVARLIGQSLPATIEQRHHDLKLASLVSRGSRNRFPMLCSFSETASQLVNFL